MDMLSLFQQGMTLVVMLSAPPLLVALLVGVLTSLIQALFQVQDQTLPFAIKLVCVALTLALTGRWIGSEIIGFAREVFRFIAITGH